jgi:outer membrane receptor protein involved in Fe transport
MKLLFVPQAAWLTLLASCLAQSAFAQSPSPELELIRVIARKPAISAAGEQLGFTTVVSPDAQAAPPRDLAELAVSQPGVSYAGQGGLLQTVSIRGLSRARVGSFYLDIPILTERRAGTAASFVDPGLVASMEVVRGPATTYYGSGNVGGLLALQPTREAGVSLDLGLGSQANENYQLVALANEDSGIRFSHRGADNTNSSAGVPLNTGFDQYNLMVDTGGDVRSLSWNLNSLLSYGEDIGKSNTLYPVQRVTEYPRERHWLGQLSLAKPGDWQGSLYFHYQDLDTSVLRIDSRRNEVDSESLDVGSHWVFDFGSAAVPLRLGADWLGRFNVKADERELRFADGVITMRDNLDAQQQEVAFFADTSRDWRALLISAGLRGTYVWQDADNWDSESDTFVSAFAGARWTLSDSLHIDAELARGDRAPSLSERFFSGTTGRSQVIGNPVLDREKVTSLDLGLTWRSAALRLEVHAYYQDIDDFIERVPVAEDLLGFQNIREGEIYGSDLIASWQLDDHLSLFGGGQWLESEDRQGDPLQDVSADELSLGVRYQRQDWQAKASYKYRFSSSDITAAEIPYDSASLLSASLSWQFSQSLSVSVWGRNLLDDEYRISSDDLATEGQQRAFGVDLRWHQGE